ncbi:VOC family protein [uncultured Alsobacter sp.]|uniref:VOC family protein n=1 Tax=uncultured Alsobacter sp. TaxID=1748258 RepID=UPI0025F0B17F|nr:VOC family protein [uncultured Alsobacter sp.]
MSRLFGPVMQTAYVVRDLDAAMAHWTGVLGVGPFFVTDAVPYAEVRYRGWPIAIGTRVAIAYSGEQQIELIQQTSGDPSMFTDFLEGGEGMHHVCVVASDFAGAMDLAARHGLEIVQDGATTAGIRFAYLDRPGTPRGSALEIVEGSRGLLRYFERLKGVAAAWDGTEAVRRI